MRRVFFLTEFYGCYLSEVYLNVHKIKIIVHKYLNILLHNYSICKNSKTVDVIKEGNIEIL